MDNYRTKAAHAIALAKVALDGEGDDDAALARLDEARRLIVQRAFQKVPSGH